MSLKPGAHIGGIRTIADLRDRCRIDEHTGCWLWGMFAHNGRPQLFYVLPDGTQRKQSARRAAAELQAGKQLPPNIMAFASACCNESLCANPAHVRLGNRTQCNRAMVKRQGTALKAKHSRNAIALRSQAKITLEIAREIRLRTEPAHVLEREYPIKRAAICNIRSGKSWRETFRGASVFAWAA